MTREKEAGAEQLIGNVEPNSVSVSYKRWRQRTAIHKLNELQEDLMTKERKLTYALSTKCFAEAEQMKQKSRDAMRRLKQ